MSRAPTGRLRLWWGQPVNAPFVTPPASLRFMLILCVLSVTGTLIYSVATTLAMSTIPSATYLAIALVYFILPVLIAHAIAVNRWHSRPLIVVYSLAIAWQAARWLEALPDAERQLGYVWTGIFLLVVFSWLYGSMKLRVYYALITGRELPKGLRVPAEDILAPGPVERVFRRFAAFIGPHIELATLIVGIIFVIAAVAAMTPSPDR